MHFSKKEQKIRKVQSWKLLWFRLIKFYFVLPYRAIICIASVCMSLLNSLQGLVEQGICSITKKVTNIFKFKCFTYYIFDIEYIWLIEIKKRKIINIPYPQRCDQTTDQHLKYRAYPDVFNHFLDWKELEILSLAI